jgi:hypothetical protein
MSDRKILLTEDEMPRQWYNILADIKMNPPLGPDGKPIRPEDLAPVFPMNLIEQEVSTSGDLPPWSGPSLWKKPWIPRRGFILKMKASVRREATNPTLPFPRPITIKSSASKD